MKGLAWYSAVIYSLFCLVCLALAVMRLLPPTTQGMIFSLVLIIYIVLTAISLARVIGFLKKQACLNKGWAIFGLAWTCLLVALPLMLLGFVSFYSTKAVFTLLSAGYEWSFIAVAVFFMLLFIPVIVFWAVYLRNTNKFTV